MECDGAKMDKPSKPKLTELSELLDQKLQVYEKVSGEIYNKLSQVLTYASIKTPQESVTKVNHDESTYTSAMYVKLNKFDELNVRLEEVLKGMNYLV